MSYYSNYPYYKVRFLDRGGHIIAVAEIECETDEEALAQAAAVLSEHPRIEVWQRERMVGTLADSETR